MSKSGWMQICTEFHRINPETSKRCTISDTELASKMAEGEKYHFYKCLNGLVDVAVPLVINGEHVANLFSGQFFFEEPDISFFKKQAEQYGFDEEKYLAALKNVPVVSKEKVKTALDFLLNMTQMISDMTFQKLEQMERNKNIRESEEKFKAVFESANVGKSITLPTGEINVNQAFCDILGYSHEELRNKKWQDITPEDEIPAIQAFINTLLTGEKNSTRFEKRYICKDGSYKWTNVSISIRRDDNGNPLNFITTVIDITESKQAEQQTIEAKQKAEESENIFSGIFKSHSAAIAIIEADTTISMVNDSYCKLSGYTREEVIGMSWTKQIPPDDLERLKEYNRIRLLYPAEAPSEYEFTFYHKNGAIKHAMMSVGIISGTKKIIASFIDITERKQAEEALRESQEKFSHAFQTSAYAITITRAGDGEFIEINDAFILITGYTREEALADSSVNLKLWANEEDRENVVADLRAGRRVEGREYQFRTKSGKNITCLFSAQIMRLSDGLCILSSINDITDRKQAEMFAIKERAISDAIIESTPGTFYMLDENGRYARWSAYQRDEIVGKPDSMMPDTNAIDTIHPEDRDLIGSRIKNVLKNGVAETVEGRVLLRGGPDFRWLLMTGRRIVIEEKPYLLGIGIDITERKQTEEKIRENSSLIRIAAEKAKLGGWNVVLKENRSYWSDEVAAIHEMPLGYAPLVEDGINFYAPEWRERITEVFTDCAVNGVPYDEEMEIITSTGRRVWVRTIGEAVRDENGQIFKVQGAFQDISEKKMAEEKLRLLNHAVESSSVSVIITDADGNINYVNPYFTELSGYSYHEVKGTNPRFLNSGSQVKEFYKELWDTILSGKDWSGELRNRKKNGEFYWENEVISPILNSDGKITNFVAIKDDISERKKILSELVVAKEKAEESDKLKTAFLNNISHEIRTPLNGILGIRQIMAESELSEEERKSFFELLEISSNRLMNTVADYVDMAMLFSKTMNIHKKDFALEPFLSAISDKSQKLCLVKNLKLEVSIPAGSSDLTINCDAELIRKILEKLIDNAIKFSKEGCITFGYLIKGEYIEFFVKDTGTGIADDKQDLIFEMFRQADVSTTRGYEGSGLGLTIAKKLVTLLGGVINVTSRNGEGSTFRFTVPADNSKKTGSEDVFRTTGIKQKENPLILIAEDNELNYTFLTYVFKSSGHKHIRAANGKEAVDICRQNPDISIVLMDIKMPVMNGDEATKLIRTFRPELPIIATTAYAQTGDENRFLEAGFTDYVPKPIKQEILLELISKYV